MSRSLLELHYLTTYDTLTIIHSHIITQSTSPSLNTSPTTSTIDAITGLRTPDPSVAEMWSLLGFDASKVHQYQHPISAKEVMFSCRTPLVHPWLSLRVLERFGLDVGRVPIEERKKVGLQSHSGILRNSMTSFVGRILQSITRTRKQRRPTDPQRRRPPRLYPLSPRHPRARRRVGCVRPGCV